MQDLTTLVLKESVVFFFLIKEDIFKDTKVGEKFKYMDGSKSPAEFPQTPPEFEPDEYKTG